MKYSGRPHEMTMKRKEEGQRKKDADERDHEIESRRTWEVREDESRHEKEPERRYERIPLRLHMYELW